jgi:hypothetical protein
MVAVDIFWGTRYKRQHLNLLVSWKKEEFEENYCSLFVNLLKNVKADYKIVVIMVPLSPEEQTL